MKKEIGIVENCNLYYGNVITNDEKYLFLDTDIQEDVKDGDIVEFYSKPKQKVKRAFFIKKPGNCNTNNIRN